MKHAMKPAILMLAILACTLNACGTKPETPEETKKETESAPQTTEAVTEEYPDQLAGLSFGGEKVSIYLDKYTGTTEFYSKFYITENEDGSVISDAAAKRTKAVEEALNVDLVFAPAQEDCRALDTSVRSDAKEYDLAAATTASIVPSIVSGSLYDLSDSTVLDLSRPWWQKNVNEEYSIAGTQYIVNGYFDFGTFAQTSCVFFSTKLAEDNDLGDLYALVKNGEWTFDKMFSLAEKVSEDLDGDGAWEIDDQYGLCGGYNMNSMLIMTTGYHFTTLQQDGTRVLTGCSEKLLDFNRMLYDLYQKQWYYNCYPYGQKTQFTEAVEQFAADKYLFFLQDIRYTEQFSGGMDNYGILPIPKYDADQEEYRSYGRTLASAVPRDAKDPDLSAAVLEMLNYQSEKIMKPAYFNVALSSRYASSPEAAEMLDIIFANVSIDFAQVWYASLGLSPNLHNSCGVFEDYASWYESIASKFEAGLQKINQSIEDISRGE